MTLLSDLPIRDKAQSCVGTRGLIRDTIQPIYFRNTQSELRRLFVRIENVRSLEE